MIANTAYGKVDPHTLTLEDSRLLARLPEGSEIYAERIRCRPGTWYTVQVTRQRRVLAREDHIAASLREALDTVHS